MARSLLTPAAALGHPTSKSSLNRESLRRWPLALLAAAWVGQAHEALAGGSCEAWHAEVVGVEGLVEVQRAAVRGWSAVAQGAQVCTGDSLRVQSGRATVRLPDQSVLRLDASTTLTFEQANDGLGTLVDLLRGALHIISRDPRSLKFTTPYANAGLEGTEFDLRVDSSRKQTSVAVLEGQVAFSTAAGEIAVPSGHSAAARAEEMPTVQALAEPIDLMRWASYYPPVLDGPLPAPDQLISQAAPGAADLLAARAAARLQYGRVDAAEQDLSAALARDAGNSTARALRSIIALARNDRAGALRMASEAVGTAPQSAAPLVALSYAEQASAHLDAALQAIDVALSLERDNALAWTRRAELEVARGDGAASIEAAARAIELRPSLGYPRTVLGFAYLSRLDIQSSIAAFRDAASLDQGAPLPRLGLGLALIQAGDLEQGRRELELAVALDPANAQTRSYMAKIYAAENRAKLTASQLELAKRFDPLDPTPWLYAALLKLNENRPVEALHDLQSAVARNDNHTVLRSSLLLDEDLATRSAGLGRLHRALGFEQLARVRGWDAVAANPTDYAGHRLLADVYSTSPRHELARVSELLVSQLLQPATLSPVPPQLAQPTSFIAGRAGPSDLAFTELAPLVAENGLKLQASSVVADHGTYGEDVALAGLHDRLSYNVGHYRFATDGFRPNNDLDEIVANAFVQFRPTAATSLQAELRSVESTKGDLTLRFDPAVYGPDYRQHDEVDSLRLGMRHDVSTRSTFLGSVIAQDHDAHAASPAGGFTVDSTSGGTSAELQNILLGRRWDLRSGFSYLRQNRNDARTLVAPFPVPSETSFDSTTHEASLYAYAQLAALPHLDVTVGASADRLDSFSIAATQINPKIGIAWNAGRFTVRAATFRTLEGSSTTSLESPQPRLEPVQVAGFNQFFFGSIGDEALTRGLGIDGSLSATLAAGAELAARTRHVPVFENFATTTPIPQTIREHSGGAYLYWTPAEKIAVSVRYDVDRVASEPLQTTDATALRTRRLPVELRYFGQSGWTVRARATAVDQRGNFASHAGGFLPGHDQFWVVDTSIGFRLPKRRGLLSLNVDNLFDERFRFQELDFASPSLMPVRIAYFRFTLAFD